MHITWLLYEIERWERVHSITGDEDIVTEYLPSNFENKLVKLSSGPQTTLGLIITVFLKFSSAFCSPENFDF